MTFSGFKIRIVVVLAGVFVLFLQQCKRPENFTDNPGTVVFSLKGTIGGQYTAFWAGVNNYYMYTAYSYNTSQSVFELQGNLRKTDCANCGPAIEISIADATTNNGTNPVNIVAATQAKDYDFWDSTKVTSNSYNLTFRAEDTGYTNPKYFWDFGNGGQTAATKVAVGNFPDTLTYNVCVTVTDSLSGCQKKTCNDVKPISLTGPDSCLADFSYTFVGGDSVKFINKSASASNFSWDFGDAQSSSFVSPTHGYGKGGTYQVCLTATRAGCVRTICKTVVVNDTGFDCSASFSYDSPSATTIPPVFVSTVKVVYTDENGEVYDSYSKPQPAGNFFTIVDSKPYTNNENGEKTRQLTVRFKCRVFSKTGPSFRDIDIGEGVIGVAYP